MEGGAEVNPEEQRIAIAEACGWVESQYGKWSNNGLILPDPLNPPDYLNDLNAMHEAEKTLSFSQETKYVANLMKQHKEYPMTTGFLATAAERAEAFLRTIGKWEITEL